MISLDINIVRWPGGVLKRRCESYDLSPSLVEALKSNCAKGIAAPQVGESQRVFAIRLEDQPVIFVNPQLLLASDDVFESTEGCLSLPGVVVTLYRHKAVIFQAINEEGKPFNGLLTGENSAAFQHEMDHLDGQLIIDRISSKERKAILPILNQLASAEPQDQQI